MGGDTRPNDDPQNDWDETGRWTTLSLDVSRYDSLCVPCHRERDRQGVRA